MKNVSVVEKPIKSTKLTHTHSYANFAFSLENESTAVVLAAANEAEMDRWMRAIRKQAVQKAGSVLVHNLHRETVQLFEDEETSLKLIADLTLQAALSGQRMFLVIDLPVLLC